jgi:DNA helicase-2/ATP-dependent DNA helicase PcrA
VLNVSDGNFPNEHAAGRPDLIEEERRLLYVAMTRAKHDLHLVAPLKYYITQQSRTGDAHVYGARSRFMTDQVLSRFEQQAWPASPNAAVRPLDVRTNVRVDAAAALRAMWE